MKKSGLAIVCLLACLMVPHAWAGTDDMVAVTVDERKNMREIAEKYLQNPDLWPDILHANGLKSLVDLQQGMMLRIPVKMILKVEDAVKASRDLIQNATRAGARALAPELITSAISNHNQALDERKNGQWEKALGLALNSESEAKEALKVCHENRDAAGQAILNTRMGRVQNRRETDLVWQDTPVKTELIEKEKVRTLSRSFGEILFQDKSRIRLNENSQVIIQKMRTDQLTQKRSSSVSLQEGDVYALLSGHSQARKFDLKLPGVSTDVNSNNFWVERGETTAKFANYDGEITVESGGKAVVLKENQGTKVDGNKAPAPPRNLLQPPDLTAPENETNIYKDGVWMKWKRVDEASCYWLEVSRDDAFKNLIVNEKKIRGETYFLAMPPDGVYYWRLASLDADALPGPKSAVRFFKVTRDAHAPFLAVFSPKEGALVRMETVQVLGKTEGESQVYLGDKAVELGSSGGFAFSHVLKPGANAIALEARDPAGNVTRITRNIQYLPDSEIPIVYDQTLLRRGDKHFLTRENGFTLKGETTPGAAIAVESDDARAKTTAVTGENGRFLVNLSLPGEKGDFTLTASLPTGFSVTDQFTVEKDTNPPAITVETSLPGHVAEAALTLKGQVVDGAELRLNDHLVSLDAEGRFSNEFKLQPGPNTIRLIAIDAAGNTSVWKKEVVLDQSPPKLLGHKVSKQSVSGGGSVQVEVQASDDSGMTAGAKFTLEAGGYVHQGYLKLCPAKNCYTETLVLPSHTSGSVKLISVRLEDHLGNAEEYVLK
jgi:hypothetical protein